MSESHNLSSGTVQNGSLPEKLLRIAALGMLVHPLALVVLTLCAWLLVHLACDACAVLGSGSGWSICKVVCCGGSMAALTLISCLALGYVGLMFLVGWNGDE